MLKKSNQKGFTIIEVLIVLAIAGLIMLVVFLAVPALQRNSRNNARNAEASRIVASVGECLNNRNGTASSCITSAQLGLSATELKTFTSLYVEASTTPTVVANVVLGGTGTNGTPTTTNAVITYGTVCTSDSAGSTTTGATSRTFTVKYSIEPAISKCLQG